MRYGEGDRESENVEDRRGQSGRRFPFPRGGQRVRIPIPMGRRGGGLSLTTLLILGALMLMLGINPLDLLQGGPGGGGFPDLGRDIQLPPGEPGEGGTSSRQGIELPGRGGEQSAAQDEDAVKRFVARVLADTEDVWAAVFERSGRSYEEPKLVLFTGAVDTHCGLGAAQVGPFYCPLDRKIYIDLSFFDELARRFEAPGDFAQAYVLAHEVGHHIQTLLGITDKVQQLKARLPERESNQVQVRMELQADCLAGMWARLTDRENNRLEPGDIEEGLNAASRIGDDTLQRQMTGRVVPDAFTHGSSAQRIRWFRQGFETGQMQSCDTFSAESP
ncbi:MAG: zinc metallopeptidase [Hyphomicrobiaceae bacterium]|nr:zinc metallopeptidase [Hyphomicrobiaceae bacterium]